MTLCNGPANNSISKSTPASKSAYGISLYVSDDPQGSVDTWTSSAEFPDQDGACWYMIEGSSGKLQAASLKQQALDILK